MFLVLNVVQVGIVHPWSCLNDVSSWSFMSVGSQRDKGLMVTGSAIKIPIHQNLVIVVRRSVLHPVLPPAHQILYGGKSRDSQRTSWKILTNLHPAGTSTTPLPVVLPSSLLRLLVNLTKRASGRTRVTFTVHVKRRLSTSDPASHQSIIIVLCDDT